MRLAGFRLPEAYHYKLDALRAAAGETSTAWLMRIIEQEERAKDHTVSGANYLRLKEQRQ
jgi:predicted DNA-binding protein